MLTSKRSENLQRLFRSAVRRPWITVVVALLIVAGFGSGLSRLVTDTSPNAFLATDNPALVYREFIKDQFGLSDPLVVALISESPDGVYDPDVLGVVKSLTSELERLPNVEQSRVLSLATQSNITGNSYGLEVTPFIEDVPVSPAAAASLRRALQGFPLYLGSLVSRDGRATIIALELIDDDNVEQTYDAVMRLTGTFAGKLPTAALHVAGEGAIAGYMGRYIESDARVLIPLAVIVILTIVGLAFRGLLPAIVTTLVVAATVVGAVGSMAYLGVPYFVITNALPIILIGIAVADAIHIYSHFFDIRSATPELDIDTVIVRTMVEMFRPVTLTTLTTVAGFLGLAASSDMPPVYFFGIFAALGVMLAWLFSLLVLPACMKLTIGRRAGGSAWRGAGETGGRASLMAAIGRLPIDYTLATVLVFSLIGLVGLYAASYIRVDEDPVEVFHHEEPIYKADRAINAHMDGTNVIDIVVETGHPDGLLELPNLESIERLQKFAHTLPHVGGSVSIVDYLKQINRAVNGGDPRHHRLPDNAAMAAQYLLLYSSSADPTDLEEEVDYDYRVANVRLHLDSNRYQEYKGVVESLQRFIDREMAGGAVTATLSGRLSLNYHWIKDLGRSHFIGMAFALLLVWLISSALFRSALAGIYTVLPVVIAILSVYAAMVVGNIAIGVGTSMFAAIAVGLGVDYAIHTLSRLQTLQVLSGDEGDTEGFERYYLTTGRALLFNFLAIAAGFGVLLSSQIASLFKFGAIVVLAVTGSFIASIILLPAMVKLFRPRFITGYAGPAESQPGTTSGLSTVSMVIGAACLIGACGALAQEAPSDCSLSDNAAAEGFTADEIVARVNAVDGGSQVTRALTMTMTDRRGKQRTREATIYRKQLADERKTVLIFRRPANVKGTAFLIWDYNDPEAEDDQWLYLPALRKTRRISASDRGDYFFGTDFTFEDMKLEGKLSPGDYNFEMIGEVLLDGVPSYHLQSLSRTPEIAEELGYSKTEIWVDPSNWMLLKADFYDTKGDHLKTLTVGDIRCVQATWTRHQLTMDNVKTGHQTLFTFTDVDYESEVNERLFNNRTFYRGR